MAAILRHAHGVSGACAVCALSSHDYSVGAATVWDGAQPTAVHFVQQILL